MDIGGFQSPRTEIDELMRNTGRPEDNLTCFAFETIVADGEERPPLADDEDLVVGMDMPARADTASSVV